MFIFMLTVNLNDVSVCFFLHLDYVSSITVGVVSVYIWMMIVVLVF
jgi:hypothetical protein